MTATWNGGKLKVSCVKESKFMKFGDFLKANLVKNDLKIRNHMEICMTILGFD